MKRIALLFFLIAAFAFPCYSQTIEVTFNQYHDNMGKPERGLKWLDSASQPSAPSGYYYVVEYLEIPVTMSDYYQLDQQQCEQFQQSRRRAHQGR